MHQRKAPALKLEHPEHFGAVIWLAEYELRQLTDMEMPQRLYDFAVQTVADLDALTPLLSQDGEPGASADVTVQP